MDHLNNRLEKALTEHQAGKLAEARTMYRQILHEQPQHVETIYLLGTLHGQLGDYPTATRYLRHALALHPMHAQAHYNLGVLFQEQGLLDEAISSYERTVALLPDYAAAHNNLGVALLEQEKHEAAAARFEHALALDPDYAEAHNNLGHALHHVRQPEETMASYARAVALKADFAEAHYNLGKALHDHGELEAAMASYARAVALKADFAEAHYNLGLLYQDQGELETARARYDQALASKPDYAAARWNRALVWLQQGNLAQGWPDYEWRWHTTEQARRNFPQPQWDGSDLNGRTILVHAEQGIGDELLFASCLPDVFAQAKHVVVECGTRLASLFARSFPSATVRGERRLDDDLSWLADAPPIDVQIAAGSLPRYLRPTLASFPLQAGYLVPDMVRRAQWMRRLVALGPGLKVGLAWRSRAARRHDPSYTRLQQWEQILTIPGVHFINLQYDEPEMELSVVRQQLGVTIHAWDDLDVFHDLDGVAALISALDVVLAPETTVAQLAGGLGQPVWQLMTHAGSWPMLGTEAQPWFPNTRVFRQPQRGDWDSVLMQMATALQGLGGSACNLRQGVDGIGGPS